MEKYILSIALECEDPFILLESRDPFGYIIANSFSISSGVNDFKFPPNELEEAREKILGSSSYNDVRSRSLSYEDGVALLNHCRDFIPPEDDTSQEDALLAICSSLVPDIVPHSQATALASPCEVAFYKEVSYLLCHGL